jgi:hypothetical protein
MPSRLMSFLTLVLVLVLVPAASAFQKAQRATHPRPPYFVGDFNTCDLSQWHTQGPERAFTIVPTPRVEGRCAAALTVGPWALKGLMNPLADGAALWLYPSRYGENGHRIWQHFSVEFAPGFAAATGEWNVFVEWHNDPGWKAFANQLPENFEYPNMCWMVLNRNGKLRLMMRVIGGSSTAPRTVRVVGPLLRTGHWYDFLVRTTWSPDPRKGMVQWSLDGKQLYKRHLPTLYRRPDGSVSSVYLIEDNYRRHIQATTTIYFDGTRIGPNRASVAYKK